MRLKSDLLDVLEAVVDEKARPGRAGVGPPAGGDGGDGLGGVSRPYERGRVINNLDEAERMADVKVFHAGTAFRCRPDPGARRPGDHRRRPGPGRHRAGRHPGRGPGPGLRGRPRHPVQRRLVSPRHRRPGSQADPVAGRLIDPDEATGPGGAHWTSTARRRLQSIDASRHASTHFLVVAAPWASPRRAWWSCDLGLELRVGGRGDRRSGSWCRCLPSRAPVVLVRGPVVVVKLVPRFEAGKTSRDARQVVIGVRGGGQLNGIDDHAAGRRAVLQVDHVGVEGRLGRVGRGRRCCRSSLRPGR